MTLSSFSRATLMTLGLGLAAVPVVSTASFARPARNLELVNRPSLPDYGRDMSNYDRDVNGSDASTPGHS
jgi:hypothetical protein